MISFRDWADLLERIEANSNGLDALTQEVRKMSQAINDRIDQMEEAATAERAEVEAALQELRDEIAAGRLNEAQIVQRLDAGIQKVKDIHNAQQPTPPEPPVEPTPVV